MAAITAWSATLSDDVLRSVYHLCSPRSRTNLLQTSSDLSLALRSAMQSCTSELAQDLTPPPLPSQHRYPQLCLFMLKATGMQVEQLLHNVTLHPQDDIVMCFANVNDYRNLQPSRISGITTLTFSVHNQEDCVRAVQLISKCTDVMQVVVMGRADNLQTPFISSQSVQCLNITNCQCKGTCMPNLRELSSDSYLPSPTVNLTRLHLNLVSINSPYAFPSTLRQLVLQTQQRCRISLELQDLTCLAVANVDVNSVINNDLPSLRSLTLCNSTMTGMECPLSTLYTARKHNKLSRFHIIVYNPSPHHLAMWKRIQSSTGTPGYCNKAVVNLRFRLP